MTLNQILGIGYLTAFLIIINNIQIYSSLIIAEFKTIDCIISGDAILRL